MYVYHHNYREFWPQKQISSSAFFMKTRLLLETIICLSRSIILSFFFFVVVEFVKSYLFFFLSWQCISGSKFTLSQGVFSWHITSHPRRFPGGSFSRLYYMDGRMCAKVAYSCHTGSTCYGTHHDDHFSSLHSGFVRCIHLYANVIIYTLQAFPRFKVMYPASVFH